MKNRVNLIFLALLAYMLYACNGNKESFTDLKVPAFPYQTYLDSIGEDESFPTIGNDGGGFDAISNNICYPEMPDTLSLSLLQTLYSNSITWLSLSTQLRTMLVLLNAIWEKPILCWNRQMHLTQ